MRIEQQAWAAPDHIKIELGTNRQGSLLRFAPSKISIDNTLLSIQVFILMLRQMINCVYQQWAILGRKFAALIWYFKPPGART